MKLLTGRSATLPTADDTDAGGSSERDEGLYRLLTRRPTRWAVWTGVVGVSLQLIGLIWDALLHHFDPTLAERESVFSLTNLSHLFIMLGLMLTVVGGVWALFLASSLRIGVRRGGAVVAVSILAVLFAATGGIAIQTGGLSGSHEHHGQGGHNHADAAARLAKDPTFLELKEILRRDGTPAALTRLHVLSGQNQSILALSHQLVHALGRYSLEHYGNVGAAMSHCTVEFESGCYHGVLEGYLAKVGDVGPLEISKVCEIDATRFVEFQCLHGLGHGLALHFDNDFDQSLPACDFLPDAWSEHSCYGGVFMQNVMFGREQRIGGSAAAMSSGVPVYLRERDLQYPCNAVGEKYQIACYQLQPQAVLLLTGSDYAKGFKACDEAPTARATATCYEAMGGEILTAVAYSADRTLQTCALGSAQNRPFCYSGAARYLVNQKGTTDEAFAFCHQAPSDSRRGCFTAVGQMIAALKAETQERYRECLKAGAEYYPYCWRGAAPA